MYQQTIAEKVSCTGIGLHSGAPTQLVLHPARTNEGISFVRTDGGTQVEIPARASEVSSTRLATTLGEGAASVRTVEHLLAAVYGLGIDNVRIEVDGPELPVMDGSAAPFVYLIQEAGIRRLPDPRRFLRAKRPLSLSQGDKRIALYPADEFKVTYTISFDHPVLRLQTFTSRITEESFAEEIAPARTFGFLQEVEMLRQRGLALGGSLDNAVVLGETGPLNTLRFEDEFVRHKILDVIGDLSLVGHPLMGHLVVERGGHALHTAFAARLLEQRDAWDLVEMPVHAGASTAQVPVGAAAPATR